MPLLLLSIILFIGKKNIELIVPMSSVLLGIILVCNATWLRYFKPMSVVFQRILFTIGLVIQIVSLFITIRLIMINFNVNGVMSLFAFILISVFWTVLYRLDISGIDRDKLKLLSKRLKKTVIVSAVLLYGAIFIIARYLLAGVISKLQLPYNAEMEPMINRDVAVIELFIILSTVVFIVSLLIVYRKNYNNIERERGT